MCLRVVKNDQAGWEQKKGREKPSQTGTKEGIFQNKRKKNAAKKKKLYAKTKTRTDVYSLNVCKPSLLTTEEQQY